MRRFCRQLGWLVRRKRRVSELQEEMQFHLDSEMEDRQATGLNRERARTETLREFGNVTLLKE